MKRREVNVSSWEQQAAATAVAGRSNRVLQEHRDRHRADASRHRRDEGGALDGAGIDVADEPCAVRFMPTSTTAEPLLTISGATIPRRARGDDEHVGVERVRGEVGGARVADRHGRVRLQEQVRDRLADDVAAADDDGARALERDAVLGSSSAMIPSGVAGTSVGRAEVELAGVDRVEAVDVLDRVDGRDHRRLVEVLGQRRAGRGSRRSTSSAFSSATIAEQLLLGDRLRELRSTDAIPTSAAALCFSRM